MHRKNNVCKPAFASCGRKGGYNFENTQNPVGLTHNPKRKLTRAKSLRHFTPWFQCSNIFIPINLKEAYHWVAAHFSFPEKRLTCYDSLLNLCCDTWLFRDLFTFYVPQSLESGLTMHMYMTTGIRGACTCAISMLAVRCCICCICCMLAFTWLKAVITGDLHEVCLCFSGAQLHNALL